MTNTHYNTELVQDKIYFKYSNKDLQQAASLGIEKTTNKSYLILF